MTGAYVRTSLRFQTPNHHGSKVSPAASLHEWASTQKSPRYDFYEGDEKLTISIFDRGADPDKVSVNITPRTVVYEHGENKLELNPLKGDVDPDNSHFTVGKVKVDIHLVKALHAQGRWGKLLAEQSDLNVPQVMAVAPPPPLPASGFGARPRKNWDEVTDSILKSEKDKSLTDDPNAGGDGAVNNFFQKLYADADDDTQRAMMKSYIESGGTTLSTNWEEVKKETITVKPPEGSEWKRWG